MIQIFGIKIPLVVCLVIISLIIWLVNEIKSFGE
jgi:uncharacterized membrane protein YoaT (DUF817 family)